MRLALAVLLLCVGLAVAWDNDWDQPLHKVCPYGYSFVRVRSIHDNGKGDRRFQFDCGRHAPSTHNCSWTGYVNNWDGVMNFYCKSNYVAAGVYSYHDNGKEDRRFKFRCCQQKEFKVKFCYWTSYVSCWDEPMDYKVPSDSVIRGFYSYHRDDKEDRKWQVLICRLAK